MEKNDVIVAIVVLILVTIMAAGAMYEQLRTLNHTAQRIESLLIEPESDPELIIDGPNAGDRVLPGWRPDYMTE